MEKKSVLIIDDHCVMITLLRDILEAEYTVYAADNGKEGIELAKKHLPDAILLDILMLDMDGYAVIAKLKACEETREIPVIFVTGLTDDLNEEKGLSFGAADYITKPFSPEIVKLRLSNQIRMREQLQTIELLSMLDPLTQLANRRAFESRLNVEWGRSMREKEPISLLIIDVDHFKEYNDKYGHPQGDLALQTLALVLKNTLKRPGDFAARWGGEEFIVLLPNTDSYGAIDVANEVRKTVKDTEIFHADGTISGISVSIGINTNSEGEKSTINEFISRADKMLYIAKNEGRNKCRSYNA